MILLCDIRSARLIPITMASPKPISADTNVEISAPTRLPAFSIQASTMSVGAGSRNFGISRARQRPCQALMKTTKTRIGGPAARIQPRIGDGWARGARSVVGGAARSGRPMVVASSVLLVRVGGAAEQRDHLADDAGVLGGGPDLGHSGVRQWHRHLGDDPAGPGAHHQDA